MELNLNLFIKLTSKIHCIDGFVSCAQMSAVFTILYSQMNPAYSGTNDDVHLNTTITRNEILSYGNLISSDKYRVECGNHLRLQRHSYGSKHYI